MSGLFEITVQEARGQVSVSADIDRLAVVIGCASSAPSTAHLSPFYLSGTVAAAAEGKGDAVDCLCQIIEQRQQNGNSTKYPACLYAVPPTTTGSVGTIDVSAIGTSTSAVTVDSSVKPYGTYEAYLLVTKGGTVGTEGIQFVWSLDDGRNVSAVTALGTATNFTIPDGNVKFAFGTGTLVTGAIVRVRTKAPQPSTAAIDAAFVALAKASLQVAIVVCEFDCDAAMAAHLTTGKQVMAAAGKDVVILPRTRIPDFEEEETEAEWGASIAADFHAFTDSDIEVNATYLLITDALTTRQYLRSDHAQWAADVVRVGRADMPNVPADQPEANVTLINSKGATIGHDEGPRGNFTGLSDETQGNRFRSVMRFADQNRLEEVFSTVPWTMYAADERIRNLPTRRVCNAIKRVAKSEGISALGGRLRYNPAKGDKSAQLTYASQLAVQAVIYHAIKAQFSNDIQNADDASLNGLVQVDPTVTVTGGNLLEINATVSPKVYGYTRALHITLAVEQ